MNKTRFWTFLQDYGDILALVVAITATLGSLYYSEVVGFVPCTLCWYQRILMYPLTLIILVGIVRQDEALPFYVLPFSLSGMGVSSYHYLIQNGVFSHPATCTVGVPCSLRYVNYLGFITIPFLAFTAFTLISVVMIVTYLACFHSWEDIPGNATLEPVIATSKWVLPAGVVVLLVTLMALTAFRGGALESNLSTSSTSGAASGETLFSQVTLGAAPGCIACHSLDPDQVLVGPTMDGIASRAAARVPGQPAGDYLRQSILAPDAHVVDGFMAGVMYQDYSQELTEAQINALVGYLLTLE